MPESEKPRKSRRGHSEGTPQAAKPKGPSPRWLVPAMLVCFVAGAAWIVVYYLAPNNAVMDPIGAWNLAIGFGLVVVGMGLATQWR